MEKLNLEVKFKEFDTKNIIIVGDVMLDSYIWGDVTRISPEAPVPVVMCRKRENRLGGAGNVLVNISALGATPILCSVIGNDEKGKDLLKIVNDLKLPTQGIVADNNRITTTKFRIISQGQHLLRVDEEVDNYLDENLEFIFFENIKNIVNNQKIDAIIFQDYDKGVITPTLIQKITELAVQKNIPTLVDPKKRNFGSYKNVTLFKPNFKELCEGLGVEIKKNNEDDIRQTTKDFVTKMNIRYAMVTLSEEGIAISNGNDFFHMPAELREIVDVSGAGDTVISTATLCLATNMDMKQVAIISNIAGGLVCEKVGVVPVNKTQLFNECVRYFSKLS